MNAEDMFLSDNHRLRQQVRKAIGPDTQRLLVHFSLYENAFAHGALSSSAKHLIGLAMSVAQRSREGVTYHIDEALRTGASLHQIREAVTVAVLAGGIGALPIGAEALAEVARLEAQAACEPPLTGTHG